MWNPLTAKSRMLNPSPSSPLSSATWARSGSQNPVPGTGDSTPRLESVSRLPTYRTQEYTMSNYVLSSLDTTVPFPCCNKNLTLQYMSCNSTDDIKNNTNITNKKVSADLSVSKLSEGESVRIVVGRVVKLGRGGRGMEESGAPSLPPSLLLPPHLLLLCHQQLHLSLLRLSLQELVLQFSYVPLILLSPLLKKEEVSIDMTERPNFYEKHTSNFCAGNNVFSLPQICA